MGTAVAENAVTGPAQRGPQREPSLGLVSLLGGVLLLAAWGLVFGALPVAWGDMLPTERMNDFLSGALLLIIGIAAAVGVVYVFYALDRAFYFPGLRAGSVVEAVLIFLIAAIAFAVGNEVADKGTALTVTLLVAGVLGAGLVFLSTRSLFGNAMVALEEQGWFHATSFKGNQGARVRRGTVLAILVIGISGIITLVSHGMLGSTRAGTDNWFWWIPGTEQTMYLPLLFRVNVLAPLLLAGVVFWFAWRLVNWPVFADFLIATEAEMNKVSWTTRKRLVQDTIVVLVTVVLLTAFLFGIDLLWFRILSNPLVNVLQVNLKAEQQKQQEKTQW